MATGRSSAAFAGVFSGCSPEQVTGFVPAPPVEPTASPTAQSPPPSTPVKATAVTPCLHAAPFEIVPMSPVMSPTCCDPPICARGP